MSPDRLRHLALTISLVALLALASTAGAHVERPSYFPDPAPDESVQPAAGGKVPRVRALSTALDRGRPGTTRVVCQPDSLERLEASVRRARASGYEIRPTDRRRLSARSARLLLRVNRRLEEMCRYREIQAAVNDSGNNDRVVVMPGLYTEPTARSRPTHDEACAQYRTNGDKPGEEGNALSYAYQFHCPNDQNLIAVMGREPGTGEDPIPPRENRHGIPNLGPCVRCNLQLEGSGVNADDVVVEAGDPSAGNGGPNGAGFAKDVAIRADRADGFVLRNVTVRHAGEHGIYLIETDGYLLDRFKAFYSRLYGTLTFASDHGRQQNCEGVGHGDSAIYPGGAPETGMQRPVGTSARHNQEVRLCDLHHNLAGYSGTNGNAVHIYDNEIYDNSLGIQTDVATAAGHPGFPGDWMLVEHNRIYSNNFNTYSPDSDVRPAFPFPVGTGMWIAGGNHHTIRENHFYDNWRRGTMVFTVPDALVCGPAAGGNEQAGCSATRNSTSHYNRHYDNLMGVRPSGEADRNGTDFWWDSFPGSRGNCWFRNRGPRPITTSPAPLPDCDDGRDPAMSLGVGNPNEAELASCLLAFETRNFDQSGPCPWVRSPSDPDAGARAAMSRTFAPIAVRRAAPPQPPSSRVPVPLGQASCADWRAASTTGRSGLVQRVRAFAGGVVNDGSRDLGTGGTLPDAVAYRLFESQCAPEYAQSFLLYKLYTHAAGLSGRR
jgi:hypothetical protein